MRMPTARVLPSYTAGILSISEAAMDVFNAIYLSSGFGMAYSSSKTTISLPQPRSVTAEERSKTTESVTAVHLSPHPIVATDTAKSTSDATINKPFAVRPHGAELAKSNVETVFEKIRPRRLTVNAISGASCIAILGSAWLAPIWVNGKLYIRQAYETNQTDTTLEVK